MANLGGFPGDLAKHIGQTVTIFTTSGGDSGSGFTGVLVSVNCYFVRLITQIGSAPGCALGNCCDRNDNVGNTNTDCYGQVSNGFDAPVDFLGGANQGRGNNNRGNNNGNVAGNRINCNGSVLGAVVDIPIDRIASFVHNAVGSGW